MWVTDSCHCIFSPNLYCYMFGFPPAIFPNESDYSFFSILYKHDNHFLYYYLCFASTVRELFPKDTWFALCCERKLEEITFEKKLFLNYVQNNWFFMIFAHKWVIFFQFITFLISPHLFSLGLWLLFSLLYFLLMSDVCKQLGSFSPPPMF